MRREQMDRAIRYLYLFRSFPSVLPQLQFGIGRHSGESRRRRLFHARVFRSTRSTSWVAEPRMTQTTAFRSRRRRTCARDKTVGDLADSRHRTPAAGSAGSALRPDAEIFRPATMRKESRFRANSLRGRRSLHRGGRGARFGTLTIQAFSTRFERRRKSPAGSIATVDPKLR
jgi:hypothetical protein